MQPHGDVEDRGEISSNSAVRVRLSREGERNGLNSEGMSRIIEGLRVLCITRVARVVSSYGNRALVEFLDRDFATEIDVSMVKVRKNSYVEVFADTALKKLSSREAKRRKEIWLEVWGKTGRTDL